jgi:hypothetical protein
LPDFRDVGPALAQNGVQRKTPTIEAGVISLICCGFPVMPSEGLEPPPPWSEARCPDRRPVSPSGIFLAIAGFPQPATPCSCRTASPAVAETAVQTAVLSTPMERVGRSSFGRSSMAASVRRQFVVGIFFVPAVVAHPATPPGLRFANSRRPRVLCGTGQRPALTVDRCLLSPIHCSLSPLHSPPPECIARPIRRRAC